MAGAQSEHSTFNAQHPIPEKKEEDFEPLIFAD
jgi:hypothetical protein